MTSIVQKRQTPESEKPSHASFVKADGREENLKLHCIHSSRLTLQTAFYCSSAVIPRQLVSKIYTHTRRGKRRVRYTSVSNELKQIRQRKKVINIGKISYCSEAKKKKLLLRLRKVQCSSGD